VSKNEREFNADHRALAIAWQTDHACLAQNCKIFANSLGGTKSENLTPTKRSYSPQLYAFYFRDGGPNRGMGCRGTSATTTKLNGANYWHRYSYRSDGAQFDLSIRFASADNQVVFSRLTATRRKCVLRWKVFAEIFITNSNVEPLSSHIEADINAALPNSTSPTYHP